MINSYINNMSYLHNKTSISLELQQRRANLQHSKEALEKTIEQRRSAEVDRLGSIPLTITVLLQQALMALQCGRGLSPDWRQSAIALVGAPPGQAASNQLSHGPGSWPYSAASDKRARVTGAGA